MSKPKPFEPKQLTLAKHWLSQVLDSTDRAALLQEIADTQDGSDEERGRVVRLLGQMNHAGLENILAVPLSRGEGLLSEIRDALLELREHKS